MKYKVLRRYRDRILDRVVKEDEVIKIADKERADKLLMFGYVEKVKRGRKPKK